MDGVKGFTLVEMLVVVAIVAVLAAIALPMFSRYRQTAFRGAVWSDVLNAVSAIAHFQSLYGNLPTAMQPNPCGPGPAPCSLTDGDRTEPNIVQVSRDVTLEVQFLPCPGGSMGFGGFAEDMHKSTDTLLNTMPAQEPTGVFEVSSGIVYTIAMPRTGGYVRP